MFCFVVSQALGQEENKVVKGTINEGDTIPVVDLKEVIIFSWGKLPKKKEKRLTRLMRNVKIVYPYAKLAGIKLVEYEEILANVTTNKERRQIMKQLEDEIEEEYGQDLRDLTFTQGKILLKLIDRETGNSSYELVSALKGKFAAIFYQAFARIFSYNLKVKYDPEGEDMNIEIIVRMIENGVI
jgi:hypothetical protein